MKAYVNGSFVEESDATVSIFDRGFMYGDGLFETIRCFPEGIFQLEPHIQRLHDSATFLGMKLPHEISKLAELVHELKDLNKLNDGRIRIQVTRGESLPGLVYDSKTEASVIITGSPLQGLELDRVIDSGIPVAISLRGKGLNTYEPKRHKTIGYLTRINELQKVREHGYADTIFVHDGAVLDATSSNVFLISGNKMKTPHVETGVRSGLTRALVLEIANGLGLVGCESSVSIADLSDPSEVFLTNSIAGIVPVASIGGRRIGNSAPGELTLNIIEQYRQRVKASLR